MPKGVYKRTKEHTDKLRPSLLKNFRNLKRCDKCGLFIGKKAHKCITLKERQNIVRRCFNKETIKKGAET